MSICNRQAFFLFQFLVYLFLVLELLDPTEVVKDDSANTVIAENEGTISKTTSEMSADHQCPQGNEVFTRTECLESHTISVHSTDYRYHCAECDLKFKTKAQLRIHLDEHQLENFQFDCVECCMKFGTSSRLCVHLFNQHSDGDRVKCPLCPKTFCLKNKLMQHLRSHIRYRPYRCGLCPISFHIKYCLIRHSRTCHGSSALLNITDCGIRFLFLYGFFTITACYFYQFVCHIFSPLLS